jgi:hypothetical protein
MFMHDLVHSPEKYLGTVDPSLQEDRQPTVQARSAYGAHLAAIADSALESESEVDQKVRVVIESRNPLKITFVFDPVSQSGLEFFAGRAGQRVEEYCRDAGTSDTGVRRVRYARRLQSLRQDPK